MEKENRFLPNQFGVFLSLTKRHLLVFLKNVPSVIFTLMVPLTVFAVYVVFLRNIEISGIKDAIPSGLFDSVTETEKTEFLHGVYGIVDCWMISGVLSVSCITVALNSNYVLVRDKERGVAKDLISSPILPATITSAYIAFDIIITALTNIIVYFLCLIYLVCYGAYMISVLDFFAIIGIILLSSISAALTMFFICSFISSESVMSPIVAITSAAVGFLIGAYLPSGTGPVYIEYVTTFFPGTYSTGLLRNFFMSRPIEKLKANSLLQTTEGQAFVANIEDSFSLNLNFFGYEVKPVHMIIAIVLFLVLFAILCAIFGSRNYMNFLKKGRLIKKKKNTESEVQKNEAE